MRNYVATIFHNLNIGITNPISEIAQFEFKQMMLQMLNTMRYFGSLAHEDPHSHLTPCIKVANAFLLPEFWMML